MALNMGDFAHTTYGEEKKEKEVVQDKYTGEQFEIERHTDFITILPNIINPKGCEHILNVFHSCPIEDECEYDPNTSEIYPSQKVEELNLSYKYNADMNKTHMTCAPESPEFFACLEVFEHLIPDHPDFQRITYMQVVQYHEDAFFPFHRDTAEETDFGTCICQLNEEYKGGQLNVQGNYIANNQGTITFFNNSTEMWHGVEPIYEGTRFVLLIWFGREEIDSQMQPVSEGTESGDSEVSLASEE